MERNRVGGKMYKGSRKVKDNGITLNMMVRAL